jgi:hypothetical protein
MAHFSSYQHPHFVENHKKWRYASDQYNGEYVDDGKIAQYLPKKEQRETDKMHSERQTISDPCLHFPTVVDGLCGIMFSKESKAKRSWGDLGEPTEPGTTAYELNTNADGNGVDWEAVFKKAAIKMTVNHELWFLVDGLAETDTGSPEGQASIKLIDPTSVVNWYPSVGNLKQVLVREYRDIRNSIEQSAEPETVYTLYTETGWRRFYVTPSERQNEPDQEIELANGEYEFYRTPDKTERILPIFRVEIPLPRNVGYLLAKKQNSIFNKISVRDFALRNISFALLQIVADANQYDDIIAKMKDHGMGVVRSDPSAPRDHAFFSPDSSYLTEYNNTLEKDIEAFYVNAFKEYGNAAAQRTATEIRLESQTGIEAYLTLLVGAIDEAENNCLYRIEQIYSPQSPGTWGKAMVERSREFQPEDVQETMKKMRERYFGENSVPLPPRILAKVIDRVINLDNLEDNELEIGELEALAQKELTVQFATKLAVAVRDGVISVEKAVELMGGDAAEVQRLNDAAQVIPPAFTGDSEFETE